MSALVNQGIENISKEIQALPCFALVHCKVEALTGGESHACFKVTSITGSDETAYFVKSFAGHPNTAITEIASNLLAAEAGLAPAIIYHSPLWLVCELIHGESLAHFSIENLTHVAINKIMIAMNLMVKTHQLNPLENYPIVDIEGLLVRHKNQPHVTPLQQVALNITISKIVPLRAEKKDLVLCHGDVNYENIRLSDSFNQDYSLAKTWLVDYECSALAEIEYDIAMFVAVNALCVQDINAVIHCYQQYATTSDSFHVALDVDKEKVRAYLACCYLINGLWYFEAASEHEQAASLLKKACQQFLLFDQLEILEEKVTPLFF